jgi:outer membrane protein
MKKITSIAGTILFLSCNPNQIAFVDYAEVMNQYDAKIKLEENYQKKAEKFARKRDSISQSLQLEFQTFQQRANKMTDAQAQQEYNGLQSRGQMIGQQLQQEEQTLQQDSQISMDSLVKYVRTEIEKYGKENGYDFVLAGGQGGTVLYGNSSSNITESIVNHLNNISEK